MWRYNPHELFTSIRLEYLSFARVLRLFFFLLFILFNPLGKKDSTSTQEIQRIIASFFKMPTPLDRALNSKVLPTCRSTLL